MEVLAEPCGEQDRGKGERMGYECISEGFYCSNFIETKMGK